MEKLVLKVEGMSCGHCKAAVEKSLKGVSGVKDAEVDLLKKTVTVSFEAGKVNEKQLAEVIDEAGYSVVK